MTLAYVVASLVAVLPAGEKGNLNLDESVKIAVTNSHAVRSAASDVEIAKSQLSLAKAQLGPKLSANSAYNRNLSSTDWMPFGMPLSVDPNTWTYGAALTLPVDLGGGLRHGVAAARLSSSAATAMSVVTERGVSLRAKMAYYGVLRAQNMVSVAEASLKEAQDRAKDGKALLKEVQIATVDYQRLEVQVSQAQSELLAAQNNLKLQQIAFNLALSRSASEPVHLEPIGALPELPSDSQKLIDQALDQRPEMKALSFKQKAAVQMSKALGAALRPSASVSMGYQRTAEGTMIMGNGRDSGVVGVMLNVPIYDSGDTNARVKAANLQQSQISESISQMQLDITQQVLSALTDLGTALSRVQTAEQEVALAEKVMSLTVVKQQAGAGTTLDTVDAMTQLTQARSHLVDARYASLIAKANLDFAIGY